MKCILHALTTLLLASPAVLHAADEPRKLNFLFITADDMNYDSAGCYGCPVKDLTPNLDRLAAEGIRFHYAYSTVVSCGSRRPDDTKRKSLLLALYPARSCYNDADGKVSETKGDMP